MSFDEVLINNLEYFLHEELCLAVRIDTVTNRVIFINGKVDWLAIDSGTGAEHNLGHTQLCHHFQQVDAAW